MVGAFSCGRFRGRRPIMAVSRDWIEPRFRRDRALAPPPEPQGGGDNPARRLDGPDSNAVSLPGRRGQSRFKRGASFRQDPAAARPA
jgi:hypothetical protein